MRTPEAIDDGYTEILRSPATAERLQLLMRTSVMWMAMVFGENTPAQEKTSSPDESQETVSFEDMENDMRDSIKQMNNPAFSVRNDAQKDLLMTLGKYQNRRNPLPEHVTRIINPACSSLTPEQCRRLENIGEITRQNTYKLPYRISCPNSVGKSIRSVLEQQFGVKITSGNERINARLSELKIGTEGQASISALMQICEETNSFPFITTDGIELKPAPENSVYRSNDLIMAIEHGEPDKRQTQIYFTPDKGVFLDTEKTYGEKRANIHMATSGLWKSQPYSNCRHTNVATIENNGVEVYLGTDPQEGTLKAAESEWLSLYPHTIGISKIEKTDGDTFATQLHGHVYADIPWVKTTTKQDAQTYQLLAANRYKAIDEKGVEMPVTIMNLAFSYRSYTCTAHTPRKPASFSVRAYTDIKKDTLTLP